jgi:hypothetical protein
VTGRRLRGFLIVASAICGSVSPALAVDGVIEINQARALAGGVTPGDEVGFPVTISLSGSYRLTGNLSVVDQPSPENRTAILVTASFVTLDLNGFSLVGPTQCSGSPVSSCSPVGTGHGIDGSAVNWLRVTNGVVRGFGDGGILGGNATVERLRVYQNGGNGIWLQAGGAIFDSSAAGNGADGFAGAGVVAQRNRAIDNGLSGFFLDPGDARDNESVHNGAYGFHVGEGLARDNVARGNVGCAFSAIGGAFGGNVANGTPPYCGGTHLGPNLCNGALCP